MDGLCAYAATHALTEQLSRIDDECGGGASTAVELNACGGDKLSQAAFLPFLPFMHPKYKDGVMAARCGCVHGG